MEKQQRKSPPPFSEEHRRKISETLKKIGSGKWNLDRKPTEKHKKKISRALKGIIRSEETRRKMSESQKGANNPAKRLDVRKKMSESHKGKPNNQLGKKRSEETKRKMSLAQIKRVIDGRNDLWKNGVSKQKGYQSFQVAKRRIREVNAEGFHSLGEWQTLKAQYNFTCPSCHKSEPEIKLTEDHIIPLIKGGSDNIENIQPLCRSCNSRKNIKIIKYL